MPLGPTPCPLCRGEANQTGISPDYTLFFECARCGGFGLTEPVSFLVERHQASLSTFRWIASHKVRSIQANGQKHPRINAELVDAWSRESLPSPNEVLLNLIRWLGRQSNLPGTFIQISRKALAAVLGTADEPDGLMFVIGNAARDRNWIRYDTTSSQKDLVTGLGTNADGLSISLTFDGWAEFERLNREIPETRVAFMAMSFGHLDVREALENAFRPAVSAAGFALRILTDDQPAGLIDDQLRVALRTSRFVIADLSYGNRGAYWEAGFAEGLGRPVFYTCERKWFEDKERGGTHFDTNHMNTVIWEHGRWEDASKRLTAMVRATLPAEAKMAD